MKPLVGSWCAAMGFYSSSICRSVVINQGSRSQSFPKLLALASTTSRGSYVREIQEDLKSKQRSAVQVTKEWLDRLKSREEALGSFITVTEEHALAQVRPLRGILTYANISF